MQFIHKEGRKIIIAFLLFLVLLNICVHYYLPEQNLFNLLILVASLGGILFVMMFFRNPKRRLFVEEGAIIAPADGKVVVIEETVYEEYFKDKRLQVSIFMSPANVHVNRNPISGDVVYNQYHKGKYLVAWHPKSSTENERHSVVIRKNDKEILVKQIAGALAKRIVNYLQVGQKVNQAEEMGFIKFGSRVDLLLPVGTKVNVELNQAVQGGVTVIASL